ncbi:MAG TPA: S41 family peptidase [Actinomycetota bacterium]|nr:S41 family peptidase [Actinomycetota bacterium]
MRPSQRIVGIALAGILVVFAAFSIGYFMGGESDGKAGGVDDAAQLSVVRDAYRKIRSSAVEPPSEEALTRGAVRGMVGVLRDWDDPYALFYSPEGYRSFQELTAGQFSGIGVWLKTKNRRLEIVSVLPSTPAKAAGLKHGDIIETIDGVDVGNLSTDQAVDRIKGPEGTKVELELNRSGRSVKLAIQRRSIELPNLLARMTGAGDLGYIRLYGFARGAGRQVRRQVDHLRSEGAEGLVLDLRDNGGGLFSEAVDVASVFIEDGPIVSYQEKAEPDVVYNAKGDAFEDLPLVVLVNEGSASASEIVAGAIQDRNRALVVGTRTYGKGSVQEVVPLRDASALKLTTAAYVTPDGTDIDGEGVAPDVVVDAAPVVQRERAIEILKGIVVSSAGAQS